MPRLRPLLAGAIGGGLVFVVLAFWLRWPTFLSVAIAAVLGVLFLMMAAALGEEAQAADAAWRSAAADLFASASHSDGKGETGEVKGAAALDSEPSAPVDGLMTAPGVAVADGSGDGIGIERPIEAEDAERSDGGRAADAADRGIDVPAADGREAEGPNDESPPVPLTIPELAPASTGEGRSEP